MNDRLSAKHTRERPLDVDKCEAGLNTSHAQGRRTKRGHAAVKTSWLLNSTTYQLRNQYIYSTNQTGDVNTPQCLHTDNYHCQKRAGYRRRESSKLVSRYRQRIDI